MCPVRCSLGRCGSAPAGRTRACATTRECGANRAPKLWLCQSRSASARKSKRTHTRACFPPQARAVGSVDGTLEPSGFNRGSSQRRESSSRSCTYGRDVCMLCSIAPYRGMLQCHDNNGASRRGFRSHDQEWSEAVQHLSVLPAHCVLLESQLANRLRPSCAQASCKECAALRQAARSALRSGKTKGEGGHDGDSSCAGRDG